MRRLGRPGGLAAFLAASAGRAGVPRTLDPGKSAGRLVRSGRCRWMFDNHWSLVTFHWVLFHGAFDWMFHRTFDWAFDVRFGSVFDRMFDVRFDWMFDRAGGGNRFVMSPPATVDPHDRPVVRLPHGDRRFVGTLAGATDPPIMRARVVVIPHNNMMIVPIEIVIKPGANGKTGAKSEKRNAKPSPRVNDIRLVSRHVDDLRIGWNNFNFSIIDIDSLLRGGLQVAQRLGLGAEALNGVHHIGLLVKERLAQRGCPRQIIVHPFESCRISGQGFDAAIPGLLVN